MCFKLTLVILIVCLFATCLFTVCLFTVCFFTDMPLYRVPAESNVSKPNFSFNVFYNWSLLEQCTTAKITNSAKLLKKVLLFYSIFFILGGDQPVQENVQRCANWTQPIQATMHTRYNFNIFFKKNSLWIFKSFCSHSSMGSGVTRKDRVQRCPDKGKLTCETESLKYLKVAWLFFMLHTVRNHQFLSQNSIFQNSSKYCK